MSIHDVSCKRHTRDSKHHGLFIETSFALTYRKLVENSLEFDITPSYNP